MHNGVGSNNISNLVPIREDEWKTLINKTKQRVVTGIERAKFKITALFGFYALTMKRTIIGGMIYSYERQIIKVGDKVIKDDLEDIYDADIHDADKEGNVIVEPVNN